MTPGSPAWSALDCADGPAGDVPRLVEELVGGGELARRRAFALLRGRLATAGRWFSASAPAVRLLAEVARGGGSDRHRPLWLVTETVVGGPYAMPGAPSGAGAAPLGEAVRRAASDCVPALVSLARDGDPLVRASAVEVLGVLARAEDLLRERAALETDEVPKVSALLALSLQPEPAGVSLEVMHACLDDESPAVRAAAASAVLRATGVLVDGGLEHLTTILASDGSAGAFAGRSWPTSFATVVAPALASGVRLRIAQALARALEDSSTITVAQQCEWPRLILSLAGLPVDFSSDPRGSGQSPTMMLPETLSDEQRRLLAGLRRADLWFAGTDVPWDAPTRRRWLGVDPPTALEKRVEPPGGGGRVPVWSVWQALRAAGAPAPHHLPGPLREALDPSERVEASLLASRDAYGLQGAWSAEERGLVLEWADRAGAAAQAVARRFLADAPPQTSERATAARILVQAGQPLEPEWDVCALTMVGNLKRIDLVLLGAMPPQRREPIALQGALDLVGIEQAPEVVRLVPTARVAERYLAAISRYAPTATGETARSIAAVRAEINALTECGPPNIAGH